MHRLTMLKTRVDEWQQLSNDAVGAQDLLELAAEENDAAVITEVERDLEGIQAHVDRLEFQTLLSGEYAENGAIVSVHAGAGGTESQDWADMLLRMYIRWAEQHKFGVQILERSEGEEAGIKRATLQIDGAYVYGHLRGGRCGQRLVLLSPCDAAPRPHANFALLGAVPHV